MASLSGRTWMIAIVVGPLLWGAAAHAQPAPPPAPSSGQVAAAQEFYKRGRALFQQGNFGAAWVEFSSAYELAQLPDLLFDLALSEEKLHRPAPAAKHYREYLEHSPNSPEAASVQAKIAQLEQEAGIAPPPPPPPVPPPAPTPPPRRFPTYSAIAGGGTLLFTVIGAAALGAASARYGTLSSSCAPACAVSDVNSLVPVIQTGQAFISLAAIGAVGTAGLLVWELKFKNKDRPSAQLTTPLGVTMYGRQ